MFFAASMAAPSPSRADAYTVHHNYATSYCLYGTMANGRYVHRRAIASNYLPMGTRIRLIGRSFHGLRRFIVSDTGPALADGHFDIWSPSCDMSRLWGARRISFKLGWGRP